LRLYRQKQRSNEKSSLSDFLLLGNCYFVGSSCAYLLGIDKIRHELKPKFKASIVFQKNNESKARIVVNQGGSGSSKTFSIIQCLIAKCIENHLIIASVVSPSLPHLKRGALRDFKSIMYETPVYDDSGHYVKTGFFNQDNWNGTDQVYTFETGSQLEFFGLEDEGRARGPRRDYLFFNEANLSKSSVWQQLILRTRKQAFIDYNPIDEFHWIYDEVLTRPDAQLIISTYKDNPFQDQEAIYEVERLQGIDDNLWRVFGLGERGRSEGLVYSNWQECELSDCKGDMIYGLDFGYNVQSALSRIWLWEGDTIYIDEMLYETHLTNPDLIERLKEIVFPKKAPIYADNAEPDRIEEIWRAGFNIHPADKSVKDGILYLKKKKIFMTSRSVNFWKEYKGYSFAKDKNGNYLNGNDMEVVKVKDHGLDSIRYGAKTHQKREGHIVMGGR
jgi:phage terminase large subunit